MHIYIYTYIADGIAIAFVLPWGLGGGLSIDGAITHYFGSPVTSEDEKKYGFAIGDSNGQQIWECLAILVALDVWAHLWSQQRVVLKIRGDNVGALFMVIKMRPPDPKHATIASEMALRLAKLSFPPDAIHTPGIAHVLADRLSRVYMPGESGRVDSSTHPALAQSEVTKAPKRNSDWYKAS